MNRKREKLITECPYCGCQEFFRKGTYSGNYEYKYRFDGKPTDNADFHGEADYKENKTAFCVQCKRSLGTKIIVN